MARALFSSALVLSVFFGPFWLPIAIALSGVFWYPFYGEAFVAALLLDLLYGAPTVARFDIPLTFTTLTTLLLALVLFLRSRLRAPRGRS